MTSLENYSGFDKAAILLQILGEQLAMPLFNSITESDMLKLRVRSIELQHTPTAIKKLIMEEYYFKMMSQKYHNLGNRENKLFKFFERKFDCLIRLKKNFSLYILSEFSRVMSVLDDHAIILLAVISIFQVLGS